MAYNNSDSSSTRSNKANHGGGPSNIFSHYQEQEDEEVHLRRAAEIERVKQGVYQTESEQTNSDNYNRAKDDFAANRARNQGAGAPFALGNNMVDSPPPRRQPRSVEVEPVAVQDGRGGDFAANRARNLGNGAPFATGESMVERRPVRQNDPPHQYVPENGDYRTPKEKQAGNRNLNRNTFQDLFGTDEGEAADHNRSRGKVSDFDPITWKRAIQQQPDLVPHSWNLSPLPPAGLRKSDPDYDTLARSTKVIPHQEDPIAHRLPGCPTPSPSEILQALPLPSPYIPRSPNDCLAMQPSPITRRLTGDDTEHSTQPADASLSMDSLVCDMDEVSIEGHSDSPSFHTVTPPQWPDRNPVTGNGIPPDPPQQIKCYQTCAAPANDRNVLTGAGINSRDDFHPSPRRYDFASTHNPVTWEAYSNYDAEADKPAHRSRYENSAKARQGQGGFNPLNPGAAPPEDLTRRSARGAHPAASTISNVTF